MSDALVIIDVQDGIRDAIENSGKHAERAQTLRARFDGMVAKLAALQGLARGAGVPVIVIQHDGGAGHPLHPDAAGWPIVDALLPQAGDHLINKRSSDSFHNTPLAETLHKLDVTRLVVGGCMTQYCIDTSVRRALSEGFDVVLIEDAHMTSDSPVLPQHQIAAHHNETLNGFGAGDAKCEVVPAEGVQLVG